MVSKFPCQDVRALGEPYSGKNRDLESGRVESSSTTYWLHNTGANYLPSLSLKSTSHNMDNIMPASGPWENQMKWSLWHTGKYLWSVVFPFSFSQRAVSSAILWHDPLPEQADALHVTHIHTTFTTVVFLRLSGDRLNLCPKIQGNRAAESNLRQDDLRSPKPAPSEQTTSALFVTLSPSLAQSFPCRLEWWINEYVNLHLIFLHIWSRQPYLPLDSNKILCLLSFAWLGLPCSRADWVLPLPESLLVIPVNSACFLLSLSSPTVSLMFGQSVLPSLFLSTQQDYKHLEDRG